MKATPSLKTGLLFFVLLLAPCLAQAHPGIEHASGFSHGFAHPFGGLDHWLAMLAVGLWAVQVSGKALWAIPATFVGVMILGGLLGVGGAPLPWVEQGIGMSILVLGVLIATATRWPLPLSSLMVGFFALCHGHAHGTEIPSAVSGFSYGAGFALATVFLHLAGIGLALVLRRSAEIQLLRYAGGAITFVGTYLLLS